jgi:MFS transporter, MHS family, shikimate and dehydroshikimate transport protein
VVAFEFAPRNRRGLFGSLPAVGPAMGGALGSIVLLAASSAVSGPDFLSWGWRIPFLVGGLLAVYAYYLRRQLPETPEFTRTAASGKTSRSPLRDAIRNQPRVLVAMLFTFFALGAHANIYTAFGASFAGRTAGLSSTALFTAILIAYGSQVLFIPLFGWLSDIVGRRLVVGFGFVVLAAMGFPFFALIQPGWPLGLWIGMLLANGLALAAVFAPIATLLAELLPSSYRYSGLALSRETGNAIGAVVVPPVAVVLSSDGTTTTLSLVLIALAALGILGLLALPRAGNHELAQEASESGLEPPARHVVVTIGADEQS